MNTNEKIADLTPAEATHPGEIIVDELKARMEAENYPGVLKTYLHKLFPGAEGYRIRFICEADENFVLRANDALKLENGLGIPAEFWLNAQHRYELARLKIARAKL